MPRTRSILHVDMDAYYASVEVREQPGLRGRPVIVGGSPRQRGVVSAASYEARRFGVHSAMPMARAMRLCPQAVRLPVRMELYLRVSRQIHAVFKRYTPQIEPLSLDEAFLDVTDSVRLFGPAGRIARRIKQEIADELSLVASVGVAPNKFVAKIASDIDKPDGFVEVRADEVQAFLDPLPASRVWGVGKATNAELQRLGIRTIAQLRQQPRALLQDRFGKFGERLWELARGIDTRPVITDSEAKSISNETTFAVDISDTEILRAWLMDLTEQVARRLRAHQRYGRTVQLKLRFEDFHTISRSHTLAVATQTTRVIWEVAATLLQEALRKQNKAIRLLGVGVSGLVASPEAGGLQQDLFAGNNTAKQQVIDQLADQIQSRFGPAGIKRGTGCKHSPS